MSMVTLGLRNLARNKARLALTAALIGVPFFLLLAIQSIGQAVQKQTDVLTQEVNTVIQFARPWLDGPREHDQPAAPCPQARDAGPDQSVGASRLGGSLLAVSNRFNDTASTRNLAWVRDVGWLDVHADWQFPRNWSLQAKLNKISDKAHETAFGYNEPGRATDLTQRWQAK